MYFISKTSHLLRKINLKTLYFNFKYLPFCLAIKLPILISKNVYLRATKGKIIIENFITTGMIEIGYGEVGIFDDKKSRSIWFMKGGTVIFKGKAHLGHGTKISVEENAVLILGGNFVISAESSVVISKKISFGNDCTVSWDVLIMDTDFHSMRDENGIIVNNPEEIMIGNKVWIGCRNLILKGAVIPDNSIIAANSLVNKKLEGENQLFAGIPVKILKSKINWEP